MGRIPAFIIAALAVAAIPTFGQTQQPAGEIKGTAWQHTPASLAAAVADGALVLPASATGKGVFVGKFKDAPPVSWSVPGRHLPARIVRAQPQGHWRVAALAGITRRREPCAGLVHLARPDHLHFAHRQDHVREDHALRASEIAAALAALLKQSWVDPARIALAGTA